MKAKLWILPVVCMYLLLISASTTSIKTDSVSAAKQVVVETPAANSAAKAQKLNFFQRAMLKHVSKKYKLDDTDTIKADQQARTSLILGLTAVALLVIGLFVPIVTLASVPAAVVAMVMGGAALRGGTKYVGQAKNGKGLGLGALIAFGVLVIAVVLAFSAWG